MFFAIIIASETMSTSKETSVLHFYQDHCYDLVAIWVKNVYFEENIVSLISTVAVYFVSGFLL